MGEYSKAKEKEQENTRMQASLPEAMLPEIIRAVWQEKDHDEGKSELTAARPSLHIS